MMRVPSLNEIRRTLFSTMQDALSKDEDAGKVFIVPPAQESDPELKKILVIASFSPGDVSRQELGGYGALAKRQGIWGMNITFLKDTNISEPWRIAELLEETFRKYTVDGLVVVETEEMGSPCAIFCEFPYSENVGTLPDNRNGITVTVPWWTWTQN